MILAMTPEQIKTWTQKILDDPEKLNELSAKEGHFDTRRTIEGIEATQLFIVLTLIGPVYQTDNQRFFVECYEHNGKKYEVTYGMHEDPLIEEVTFHPLSRRGRWHLPA